jgi:site-specific DNA-methyltransferase (adenine-specific)
MPTILPGDNRASLAAMAENSIDAVVTDPPYSLTSITKRFGAANAAPAKGGDGSFGRVSGGFMGKSWDATGIERDPEFWAAVYRVLKPGAFAFAFSGARTGHWQACAMEQAGFVMHPMHAWIYGQGFPKGHDASKAIDKHLGVEGDVGGYKPGYASRQRPGLLKSMGDAWSGEGGFHRPWMDDPDAVDRQARSYLPGSPEAQQWDGYKYGTQTQKPAMEPIYLAQKPYEGKPVESILKWGVGAFNIDGCRVPAADGVPKFARSGGAAANVYGDGLNRSNRTGELTHTGRYPANVLHDGSDVVLALFPYTKSTPPGNIKPSDSTKHAYGEYATRSLVGHTDEGSAARFFNSFPVDEVPWPLAFYHAKAGKADRAGAKHPTVKPIGLLRHLIRHVCPPEGTVLDPFAGSGTTAEAARLEGMGCVLMEAEPDYLAFLRRRFVSEIAEDIFA